MRILSKFFYRVIDESFIQPIYDGSNISSTLFNDSMFATTASSTFSSSYSPFYLFNQQYASGGDDSGVNKIWESGNWSASLNPWIKFTNPIPINLQSITFDFRVEHAGRVPRAVTIYGGNSDNSWVKIKDKTSFIQERTLQTINLDNKDYYKGYYLYMDGSSTGTGAYIVTEIANLNIMATYEVNE